MFPASEMEYVTKTVPKIRGFGARAPIVNSIGAALYNNDSIVANDETGNMRGEFMLDPRAAMFSKF
jgi:hypothetical protein